MTTTSLITSGLAKSQTATSCGKRGSQTKFCGAQRGLLSALILSVALQLSVATPLEGVSTSPSSQSFNEETVEDRSVEEYEVCEASSGCSDERALLQTVLQVRDFHNRSQIEIERPAHRCTNMTSAIKISVMLAMPYAAMVALIGCVFVFWLEVGRKPEAEDPPAAQPASGGGQAQAAGGPAQAVDRSVPTQVFAFLTSGMLLISTNFTIVLPGSERTMVDAGGTTFLSGLAIGSYALGSIISLPLVLVLSRHSYKGGVLFMSVMAFFGNFAYAAVGYAQGSWAIVGMMLARMMCGLEGGVVIVFGNAICQLASGPSLAKNMATFTFVNCLGLAVGPCLSSIGEMVVPNVDPEIPPAILMMVISTIYGICAAIWFPDMDTAFKMAGLEGYKNVTLLKKNADYSLVQLRSAWLALALGCIVNSVRLCQRVLWEAGALLIFVREYGYSERVAAFWLVVPVIASTPLVKFAGHFNLHVGPVHFVRSVSLMELGGIFLMFQVFKNDVGMGVFIFASFLFYASNLVSMVPIVVLRTKFQLQGHSILNMETTTAVIWVCSFVGYFFGPVLSRAAMAACPHQNLLAVTTLVIWMGSAIATELGLHSLLGGAKEAK